MIPFDLSRFDEEALLRRSEIDITKARNRADWLS